MREEGRRAGDGYVDGWAGDMKRWIAGVGSGRSSWQGERVMSER